MAQVSTVHSDDDAQSEGAPSGKKNTNATKSKKSEEPMDVDEEEEDGGGSQEESEYEIEAILDAKRGSFPEGRMGYFVKWKGYDDSENSWVDEKDAGNAEALIEEYWKKHPKKARKSVDAKTPKRAHRSVAPEEGQDGSTKKRGRKSQANDSAKDAIDADEKRAAKKVRKSDAGKDQEEITNSTDEEIVFGDMNKYMSVASWETLVKNVDTIERQADGTLIIYFALNTGERVREKSSVCATRFPQKLIQFYEGNLRWKTAQEHEAENS